MAAQTAADGRLLRNFRFSRSVAARFVFRRTLRLAILWGAVFGVYVYAAAIGFLEIAPNAAARAPLLASISSNVGLKALFGEPHDITSLGGFVDWRNLSVIVLIGAIWGLMTATKQFRGEEMAGRTELFLAGQTTAGRAAAQTMSGLGASLTLLFAVTAAATALAGLRADIGFTLVQASLFAGAAAGSAGMFLAIGALASQIMPTRAAAAGVSAALLGVGFIVRAAADLTSSAHWLIYCTPLGWLELIRPLGGDARPIWLVPVGGLTVLAGAAAAYLASRRDLGASIVADRDTARPHTALLGRPQLLAVRLTRTMSLIWLAGAVVFGAFFGSLANSVSQVVSGSNLVQKFGSELTRQHQTTVAKLFASFILFLLMLIIMNYAASAISAIRNDEAAGYLDNLLVRKVGRLQWLWGRLVLVAVVTVAAGILGALALWASAAAGGLDLGLGDLVVAGLNAAAPALLVLGVGVCLFGLVPRRSGMVLYGLVAWSFLLQLLGSILNLNHWVLDTSILYHVALAPSVGPNWRINGTYLAVAAGLAIVGACVFRRRDIMAE